MDGRVTPKTSTAILYTHDCTDGLADPLGRRLDVAVPEMGVAQRHAHIAFAEQPRDDRHQHSVHYRVAGMPVALAMNVPVIGDSAN